MEEYSELFTKRTQDLTDEEIKQIEELLKSEEQKEDDHSESES